MAKSITVRINKKGTIFFDYQGFQGAACITEAEAVWDLLKEGGIEASDDELTMHKDGDITDDPMLANPEAVKTGGS